MERNVMGELNVYRGSGAKPNFSEIARRHGMDRHTVAKYWREGDPGARRHAAKGVRRLVERREALLARGVHGNKANVATARELACWVWAVGLMAEEA